MMYFNELRSTNNNLKKIKMKSKVLLTVAAAFFFAVSCPAQGVLGKLKQKAAEASEKALEKKVNQKKDLEKWVT